MNNDKVILFSEILIRKVNKVKQDCKEIAIDNIYNCCECLLLSENMDEFSESVDALNDALNLYKEAKDE